MEPAASGPASPPDPPQDQPCEAMPERIAFLLQVLATVLGFGRHLLGTVQYRATTPSFSIIAACFGTAKLSTILAHLNRGILRATALQRVLLARATTGRDIEFGTRRTRAEEPSSAPSGDQPQPPARQPATPRAARRRSPSTDSDNPELFMPTLEDLERQIRRRTLSRTLAEICLDLAVVPDFCTRAFWNKLFEIMYCHGGGGVVTLMRENYHRRQAFVREQDQKPGSDWDWMQLKRDAVRQILGFRIGEELPDPPARSAAPGDTAAAQATGPP